MIVGVGWQVVVSSALGQKVAVLVSWCGAVEMTCVVVPLVMASRQQYHNT